MMTNFKCYIRRTFSQLFLSFVLAYVGNRYFTQNHTVNNFLIIVPPIR